MSIRRRKNNFFSIASDPSWRKLHLVAASPYESKLASDLRDLPAGAFADVLVQFSKAPANSDIAELQTRGAKVKTRFKNVPAALVSLPPAALSAIASLPFVRYVSPDRRIAGSLEYAVPTVGGDIAFQSGWTGSGVGVAIVDSGVAGDHPDLKSRIVYSQNFVTREARSDDPYGHGTHVAGIVAGNAAASYGPSYARTFRGLRPKLRSSTCVYWTVTVKEWIRRSSTLSIGPSN